MSFTLNHKQEHITSVYLGNKEENSKHLYHPHVTIFLFYIHATLTN